MAARSSAPSQDAKKAKAAADPKKPRVAPAYPSYLQMSAEAIAALKERTGSSQLAIAKWIEGKYAGVLPANFKKQLSLQLKKLSQKGKLVQIKHSYKLSDELKKPAKAVKKIAEKQPAVKDEKKVVAKTAKSPKKVVKKSVVKSVSTPKKAVKPKTVRKTAAGGVKRTGKESKSAETKKAVEKEVKRASVKKPAAATETKKKSASGPGAVKARAPTSKKAKATSS